MKPAATTPHRPSSRLARAITKLRLLAAQLKMRQALNRVRSLVFYRALFRLILTVFSSLAITFFIFRVYYGEFDLERFSWIFQPEHNRIFAVSWLVVFLLNLILLGLFHSVIVASGSLAILTTIWLFVNQVKMTSRQTPFLPEDLLLIGEARQVASVISPSDLWFIIGSIGLIVMMMICGLILTNLLANFPKTPRRTRLALSLVMIIVGSFGLNQVTHSIKNPATILKKDNFIGNDLVAWNQQLNYHWNGPVIGFIYNIGKLELAKPDGYSKQRIAQIVERYNQQAHINNLTRISPDQQPINIALVLSESLVDPNRLTHFYPLQHNPIPWLTQALKTNPSGQLATSEYGGGTANVEFEILTGLSTTLNQNTTPFTHFLPKIAGFPSLAQSLKQAQFQTAALHNFLPEMYKRNLTYPNLGIDKFYGVENFKHRSTIDNNPYDSDYSFYQQLLDELRAEPTKSKFINGVTMQNHAPYDNFYQSGRQFAKRGDLNDEQYHKLETYLTGLYHTDQALADFYQKLQTLPQKTLVIVYGDHFPGSDVFGKIIETDPRLARRTPIVMLANFPLPAKNLGTLSGNYLSLEISKLLNWKQSGFDEMRQQLQVIMPKLSFFHSDRPGEFRQQQIYRDYELIQYDLLSGQRFSQKMGFFDQK